MGAKADRGWFATKWSIRAINGFWRDDRRVVIDYVLSVDSFSKRLRLFVAVAFGSWLVVGTALWILGGPTGGAALEAAIVCTLGLAFGTWWVSGRFRLSSTRWPGLVGLHAFLALLFGSLMIMVTYSFEAASAGSTLAQAAQGARFLGAEFVFWIWLYGVVAVISHGIRMRETLRDERERVALSEARLSEARLESLRGQLNPHFLFNALHTVGALVPRDPKRASHALELLGELLRYSLDGVEGRTVELDEEVRFTRAYLELMDLALGDRLRFTLEVAEEARDGRVPPFSLQTLTENAVRHGVTPRPEGGTVEIRVRSGAEGIEMAVENDAGGATANSEGTGRGLTNLRDRLSALYGDRGQLEAASQPDGGFYARIVVPGE